MAIRRPLLFKTVHLQRTDFRSTIGGSWRGYRSLMWPPSWLILLSNSRITISRSAKETRLTIIEKTYGKLI